MTLGREMSVWVILAQVKMSRRSSDLLNTRLIAPFKRPSSFFAILGFMNLTVSGDKFHAQGFIEH